MKQVLILLFVLALFVVATVLNAQTFGTLEGTVVDEYGEAIPGATVRIIGTSRGAATGAQGDFLIAGLRAGIYLVQVTSLTSADTALYTVSIAVNTISCESLQLTTISPEVISCPSSRERFLVNPNTTGKITELRGEDLLRRN